MKIFVTLCLQWFIISGVYAQNDTGLVVHEWGTFTAQYTHDSRPKMDVHKRVEEPVPDFVFRIGNEGLTEINKGKDGTSLEPRKIYLKDITIRMETPVIYFYSNKEIHNVKVNVGFRDGSINELFPIPEIYEDLNHLSSLSSNYGAERSLAGYIGRAQWNINILDPKDTSPLTHPDSLVPFIWKEPRNTKSNKLQCNKHQINDSIYYKGNFEKYLFYRGIGSFENQLIPYYTESGNLILKNKTYKPLNFVMVMEVDKNGNRFIWRPKQNISENEFFYEKTTIPLNEKDWINKYRLAFINALVKEGLYEDEANVMLSTWNESYFEKPGIKIFWITPTEITNKILPLSISEPVQSLKRVLVGRTEIDPFQPTNIRYYKIKYLKDPENLGIKTQFYSMFPNPVTSELFLKSNVDLSYDANVVITDPKGKKIEEMHVELSPYFETVINTRNLHDGVYFLTIYNKNHSNTLKFIVRH